MTYKTDLTLHFRRVQKCHCHWHSYSTKCFCVYVDLFHLDNFIDIVMSQVSMNDFIIFGQTAHLATIQDVFTTKR